MVRPVISERQLWRKLKNATTSISWTRLENWALFGTPDLLGYTSLGTFFTVELKITQPKNAYFVRFSPHQISFHIKHKKKYFCPGSLCPGPACTLVPWLQNPGAWRLEKAWTLGLWPRFLCRFSWKNLVYFILNFMDVSRPACATVTTVVALLRRRAHVTSSRHSHHSRPMVQEFAGFGIIFCVAYSNN